jgi:hypothetical protein
MRRPHDRGCFYATWTHNEEFMEIRNGTSRSRRGHARRRCCTIQSRSELGCFLNLSFTTPQRRTWACRARPSGSGCDTRSRLLSFAPCCSSPSGCPRALTCTGRNRSQPAPAVGSPTPSATLVVQPYESSEEPLLAAATVRPWVPPTPHSDEDGSRSRRPLYRPRRPDRRSTCGRRPRPP